MKTNNIQSILEYSSMKRLPFEEDEFKNKNYIEQYTDWLEDFGRYGTLPSSTLDFWEEIQKAIHIIIEKNLQNHNGLSLSDNPDEILSSLKEIIGNNIQVVKGNKVYIERAIQLNTKSINYDKSDNNGNDPQTLYNTLVQNYNHNVGGCWSYKQNGAKSYCSIVKGDIILLKGYIRTDDIDFVKTVLLNFHYPNEHEIRVKPNAKVELFEALFDCKYKAPLRGNLIVSATYFGNNGKYNGNYAQVDDGFGNNEYMDRKGNISNITAIINNMLSNNENINSIIEFEDRMSNNFYKIMVHNKYNILDIKNKKLLSNEWFNYIDNFEDGYARIQRSDNHYYSFIDINGNFINNGKLWFNYAYSFEDGFAKVLINKTWYYIDKKINFYDSDSNPIKNPLKENKLINIKSMKKQIIRLTESDLHKIIENSVKRYLNEISMKTVHSARNKARVKAHTDPNPISSTIKKRQSDYFNADLQNRMKHTYDWSDKKDLGIQNHEMNDRPYDFSTKQLKGSQYFNDFENGKYKYSNGKWEKKMNENHFNNDLYIPTEDESDLIEYANEWKKEGATFDEWADAVLKDNPNYSIDDLQDAWYAE